MPRFRILACLALSLVIAATASAVDWTQFRGPGGSGAGDDTDLPVKWSATDNIAWRARLPGLGTSSPITLGNRIYVTCYSGYAEDIAQPGDIKQLMRHVVCLDRKTGDVVWQKQFKPELPESDYRPGNDSRHGYASSTPTTDGERLYVQFGKSGVYCLNLEGNEIWHKSIGSGTHHWGSGASPVLYQNLLIVNASVESRALIALDKLTGEEVWRVDRISGAWNTPLLVDVPGGGTELVLSLPQRVGAFDPADGKRLWHCNGIPDGGYICPSAIAHDGIVYLIGGRQNTAIAIRAGGRDDVSDSHVVWRVSKGSNVSSPVYHDGHIYWFHEKGGIVCCLNAKDGDVEFEERLSPRPGLVYSSVTVADGKLYCVSQHDGAYVVAAKPDFELLAHNEFKDDDSRANACIVPHGGQLLLRNDTYLYCIGAD